MDSEVVILLIESGKKEKLVYQISSTNMLQWHSCKYILFVINSFLNYRYYY